MASSTEAMATAVTVRQLFKPNYRNPHSPSLPILRNFPQSSFNSFTIPNKLSSQFIRLAITPKASSTNESIVEADAEDGVQLGTMKLPPTIDIPRFEILLFQWANSLCQGANLPLPMPLKVDKISGGARLGFIEIGDAKTEVPVYIDCLVFPGTETSGPIFRAIRNGRTKDRSPPGEPRIMRSLQEALKKSVEIASV